jgi:acyl transferase domain-containing protein/NAD(P)-dependent dehydrogenase (short-subunit alcohol dehydrogenase family)
MTRDPLAIVGVGCRFPGAADLEGFRTLLFQGACSIRELPPHRFDQRRYYDPEVGAYGKSYSRLGGWIEDGDFDPLPFGLPPEAARSRDRAHLWALQVARATFAHAGIGPEELEGSNTAVILGHARGSMTSVDVAFATAVEELVGPVDELPSLGGLSPETRAEIRARAVDLIRARYTPSPEDGSPGPNTSAVAGLISRTHGLTGRHMVVDAACASSLAAIAMACRALRNGSIDMALAGGVSFSQEASVILFAQSRALSARGSFPFDARADGFISSDGVGMILLERLSHARSRGHRVYALVRGFGAASDGKGKGLWAPRKEGQILAIARALESAGVEPSEIGYVEAHGTSTTLGDATEIAALAEALGPKLAPGGRIPVGSVKGNIGHCREAAGIAGVIKTLIALEAGDIPPSIGCENESAEIPWASSPLEVVRETRSWPKGDRPRIAAVNSFGIGGINYQVLIEEAPREIARSRKRRHRAARRDPAAIVGMGALFAGASNARDLWRRLCAGERGFKEVAPSRWSSRIYFDAEERKPWRTDSRHGAFLDEYRPDWRRYHMPPALVEANDPLQFMLLDCALEALEDARIDLEVFDRARIGVVIGSEFGSDFALALTLAIRVPELTEAVLEVLQKIDLSPRERSDALGELEARIRERVPRISEDSSGSFSASTLASRIAKTLDLNGPVFALDASSASSLASLEAACELLDARECDVVLYGGGDRSMRVQRFEAYSRAGMLARDGASRPFAGGSGGFLLGEGAGIGVLMRLGDARAQERRVYAVVKAVGSASDGERRGLHQPSASGLAQAIRRAHRENGAGPSHVSYIEAHGAGVAAFDAVEIEALRATGHLEGREVPLPLGSVKSNVGHTQGAAGVASVIKTALAIHHRLLPPTPGFAGAGRDLGPGLSLATRLAPFPRDGAGYRAGISAVGACGIYYHAVLEDAPEADARSGKEPIEGLCFLFTGQGSQYAGMHREIAEAYPQAAEKLGEIDRALVRLGAPPVSSLLWGDPEALSGTLATQLAILAGDLMMYEVARARGLEPALLTGHSYGDYPALVAAGALALEDAIRLTLARCAAIEAASVRGGMLAVFADPARVGELLSRVPGRAFPSNVNSREQVVVSGEDAAIEALMVRCLESGIECRRLAVAAPFHCPLMEPVVAPMADAVSAVSLSTPSIPFLSSVGARYFSSPEEIAQSLVEQLTRPVDFIGQIERAYADGFRRFVEVGPGTVLANLTASILGRNVIAVSLDHKKSPGVPAVEKALLALRPSGVRGENPSRRGAISFFDATEARRNGAVAGPRDTAPRASLPKSAEARDADGDLEDRVRRYLLDQVIERTGYPPDLIQFDQDMEADLGIDSVKQAQIFGSLREHFDLKTDDALSLRDFPTLDHVLRYVVSELRQRGAALPGPAVSTAGEPFEPVAPRAPERPEEETPLLRLEGSPFEIGLQHGLALRGSIQSIVAAYEEFLGQEGARRSELREALDGPERFFDPIAIEELRGLAQATGLPLRHLMAYNLDTALFPDYASGCVQIGLAQGARGPAEAPPVIHAFNEDSPLALHLKAELESIVQVRRPEKGIPHVLFSLPGRIGGGSGINRAGLAVTSSVLLERSAAGSHKSGLLHPILVRRMLSECSTQDRAVGLARSASRGGAWSVLLSHARETRLRGFEYDGQGIRETKESDRHLVSNHSTEGGGPAPPEHSLHRLARLRAVFPDDRKELYQLDEIRRILLDRFDSGRGREVVHRTMNTIHRVDNLMGLVIDPARGALFLAGGRRNGSAPRWRELLVRDLFPGSVDASPKGETRPSVMTRFVLRSESDALPEMPPGAGRYEPRRLLILGGGILAETLRRALLERGTDVTILALEASVETLAARMEALLDQGPSPDLCLLSGVARAELASNLDALASGWSRERERVLEAPYAAVQAWARRVPGRGGARLTLSAVTALGGSLGAVNAGRSLPEGGAILGWLKALRLELPQVRVKALDVEAGETPESVARAWIAELDSASDRLEVGLLRGERRIVRMVPAAARFEPSFRGQLGAVRSWLITGGARGITARIALRLAELGVRRFHLLGRSELDPRVDEWRELDERGRERIREKNLDEIRRQRGSVSPLDWKHALEPIDRALEIDRTLRALAAAGAEAAYHAADVSSREALASVLARIRAEDGPIEAVVHGAGVERSCSFLTKPIPELRATLAAKVDGTLNLLALTASDPLRYFVAFSSVSGRFGGPGQTDYAMASEMLARLTAVASLERPEARIFAISWPAWAEVGMAVRESVQERLEASGQKLMPVAEGCDHFVAELLSRQREPEVTFAERLDRIDLDRTLPGEEERSRLATAVAASERLPLIDSVLDAGPSHVVTECRLDAARDVFLLDHRMGSNPILPAAVGLEILAETASLLRPQGALALEGVSIQTPLKLRPEERILLRCRARATERGIDLTLAYDPVARNGRILEIGRVLVKGAARLVPLLPGRLSLPPRDGAAKRVPFAYRESPSPDPRSREMYHGPALRGLDAVYVTEGDTHIAEIVAGTLSALAPDRPEGWLLSAAAIDDCLKACGVVGRARLGLTALPARFESVRVGRAPAPGERCRASVRFVGRSSDELRFDVTLVGSDGSVLVDLAGYGATIVEKGSG